MKRRVYISILFILILQFNFSRLHGQSSTISGIISEEKTGEVIIGASVSLLPETKDEVKKPLRGTYSNKFGFYSLTNILAGEYRIVVRGIGYKAFEKVIKVSDKTDIKLNVNLLQIDIRLQDVIVESNRETILDREMSIIKIPVDFLSKIPTIGGEKDIFRGLLLLPGIKQSNELSSGLYVRGGSPDQNLILLDGVVVYNPNHIGGFLSTFNSDALSDVKLIKGAFPAEYGGRISSVIDLTMKEGTREKFSGSGGISLINSRLILQGPINENATFMVSGRRMYLDLIFMMFNNQDDLPQYVFYDLNAKVNYKISETDRIFLSGFWSKDIFSTPPKDQSKVDMNWGNSVANLRWMHIVSPSLFTNFSLIYSDFNFNTSVFEQDNTLNGFSSISKIHDWTLRTEAQYFPSSDHTVKSGFESIWHTFRTGAAIDLITQDILERLGLQKLYSMETSFYIQDEWQISPGLSAFPGGRFLYFQKGNYIKFEPRISVSYAIAENIILKSSFAAANQFLHLIQKNDIPLPTDLWFPSSENVKPCFSTQGVLGIETNLLNGEYLATAEAYYKDMKNLYEYRDTARFILGLPLETDLTEGRGEAYGFELFINKRSGSFTGWLGYTLAWTKRYFNELNNGKPFYPRYDRRHDISLVFSYEFNKSLEMSSSWTYSTGQAYTVPTSQFKFITVGEGQDYSDDDFGFPAQFIRQRYSERNGYRLPSFHKLDLNFIYKFEWFKLPFELSVSIYNVYNNKNPFSWYISTVVDPVSKTTKGVVKQITLFPTIPSLGLNCKF